MTNSTFDPYHRWLGIPPKHQPPDYYRLLALERYEDDEPVKLSHVIESSLPPHLHLSDDVAGGLFNGLLLGCCQ